MKYVGIILVVMSVILSGCMNAGDELKSSGTIMLECTLENNCREYQGIRYPVNYVLTYGANSYSSGGAFKAKLRAVIRNGTILELDLDESRSGSGGTAIILLRINRSSGLNECLYNYSKRVKENSSYVMRWFVDDDLCNDALARIMGYNVESFLEKMHVDKTGCFNELEIQEGDEPINRSKICYLKDGVFTGYYSGNNPPGGPSRSTVRYGITPIE
ncbi:hypothetical protein ACFLRF_03030 [Candidatus Altiarchaeota archaeon]